MNLRPSGYEPDKSGDFLRCLFVGAMMALRPIYFATRRHKFAKETSIYAKTPKTIYAGSIFSICALVAVQEATE